MLDVQLLGGATIRSGGTALGGPPAQRHRLALLALVADAWPHPLARDRAIALLWPERDAPAGRRLLNLAVHVLRNALGDASIASVSDGLLLAPELVRCDLLDLRQAAAVHDHRAVVAAYGGPFLEGLHLPDSGEFEDWLSQRRSAIARMHVNALAALADEQEAVGERQALVATCERLTAAEPHSAAHALRLMRALAAVGERASAVAHASTHARYVRETLGLEPEVRVTRLAAELRTAPRAVDSMPVVAVLPFLCIGGAPDQDVFADGMTEDVIAHLAKVGSLGVISRASTMPFKDRNDVLARVRRALTASAVLDGSVRFAGGRVRIVATLLDVASGRELWVDTFDRDLTDIFALQSEVAVRIAGALRAELTADEGSRIRSRSTTDLEAYRHYIQGRRLVSPHTVVAMRHAAEQFERAIATDPSFALAHAHLAMTCTLLGEHGVEHQAGLYARAAAVAARALELDPSSGDAHAAAGYLRMVADHDWDGALAGLRRALELSPGSAFIHDSMARAMMLVEDYDAALEHAQRAQQLDPITHRNDLTTILLRAGRLDQAMLHARDAVATDPEGSRSHATLGWACLLSGQVDEGLAALQRAVALEPGNELWYAQLGHAYGRSGRRAEAQEVLHVLETRARDAFVSPYYLAYVHAGLGDTERALDCLEQAAKGRTGFVHGVKGSFFFTDLRDHPRFRALLRSMNAG